MSYLPIIVEYDITAQTNSLCYKRRIIYQLWS